MKDSTKLTNAQLLSTSYNSLQQPKIATMGDRSPVTGLYESQQGGSVLTRKISNGSSSPSQPALIRGEVSGGVATADVKNASVSVSVSGFSSVGSGELNKNLWGRDVLGDPVDNVPAFYWFGSIEDSTGRIEITPSDYQNYNAMAFGSVFPRGNESVTKIGAGKKLEVIAGVGGKLTVKLSYFGNLVNELFTMQGATEVWAKAPGIIKASRRVVDVNRTGFGSGIPGAPPDPRNFTFTAVRGNPGDRSGASVTNGNFHRLNFDIGTPGNFSLITDLPFYYSNVMSPVSVPIAPDVPISVVNFV